MAAYLRPWIAALRAWLRVRSDYAFEVAALRQQLAMYERRRPDVRDSDLLFWVLLVRLFPGWRDALVAVRPETVVRWHRTSWRRYLTWKSRPRRRGRPRIDPEARELIMRFARENRTWGAVRIQGELRALGHDVSAETVRRYRLQALRRPPSKGWRAFLHNHPHEIWACDFFAVPTISFTTLYVFFFVSHARRRIEHLHVTQHPTAAWVWRQLIEATPWGHGPRFLIRDRDRSYGGGLHHEGAGDRYQDGPHTGMRAEGERDRRAARRDAAARVHEQHHSAERAAPAPRASRVRRLLQRHPPTSHPRARDT